MDLTTDKIKELGVEELIKEIQSQAKSMDDINKFLDQFNIEKHSVMDVKTRPNKLVKIGDNEEKLVNVARLPVPFQKIITNRSAAFLVGEPIKLMAETNDPNEQLLFDVLKSLWEYTKLDFRTRELARYWMSETEVAELWYMSDDILFWDQVNTKNNIGKIQVTPKVKILANSKGDRLYPHFNSFGDMDVFGRQFTINDSSGKNDYFTIYTAETITQYFKGGSGWELMEGYPKTNIFAKIPVIYYPKDRPEWGDVQPLIERFETMISNFADSNDYFASPMIKVKGQITGFAQKGEQGKVLTMEENADASYLTWDNAPEAIKFEHDTLKNLINSMTQNPDISFEQMKGIGAIAGIAIRIMFLDAELKTLNHQEVFGEGILRRLNLLRSGLGNIAVKLKKPSLTLKINPEFNFYMPQDEKEIIGTLSTAVSGEKIMSVETAMQNNPFVKNVNTELEKIKAEDQNQIDNFLP